MSDVIIDDSIVLRGDSRYQKRNNTNGGHTIVNSSGTSMTQRPNLKFANATVTDDPTNNATVVTPSSITVDDALSSTSENPVQNKVVTGQVNNLWAHEIEYGVENLLPNDFISRAFSGITWAVDADGIVTANGTATGQICLSFQYVAPYTKSVRFVGCPANGSYSTYWFNIYDDTTSTNQNDLGSGRNMTITEGHVYVMKLFIKGGYTASNLIFKPMMVDARYFSNVTYNDHVPYAKSNRELTAGITGLSENVNQRGSVNIYSVARANVPSNTSSVILDATNGTVTFKAGTYSGYAEVRLSPHLTKTPMEIEVNKPYVIAYKVISGTVPSNASIRAEYSPADSWANFVGVGSTTGKVLRFTSSPLPYYMIIAIRIVPSSMTLANDVVIKPMLVPAAQYEICKNDFPIYSKSNEQLTSETTGLIENEFQNGCVNILENKFTTQASNNVTYTVNSDRTITAVVSAASASDRMHFINSDSAAMQTLGGGSWEEKSGTTGLSPNGKYRITGNPSPSNMRIGVNSTGIYIYINKEVSSGTYVFKPMISLASLNLSYDDYVPYAKSNKELTAAVATNATNITAVDKRYRGGCYVMHIDSDANGWIDNYAQALGVTKTTTLKQLIQLLCSYNLNRCAKIVICTNYGNFNSSAPQIIQDLGAALGMTSGTSSSAGKFEITVNDLGNGRLFVEFIPYNHSYKKYVWINNWTADTPKIIYQDVLDIAHGGTGATTVAGARNALGLGNTSGALPIANGGTGATTIAAALTNLGIGIGKNWTPHIYDYETYKRAWPASSGTVNAWYFEIGNIVIATGYWNGADLSDISTMLQIRNLPMDECLGGSIYIAGMNGQGGDRTIQQAVSGAYIRPNITSAQISTPSNAGVFSFMLIGRKTL